MVDKIKPDLWKIVLEDRPICFYYFIRTNDQGYQQCLFIFCRGLLLFSSCSTCTMSWMEEVSYQYRQTEYFFIDVPAIFQYCLPALLVQFLRTSLLQLFVNAVHQLITTGTLTFHRPNPTLRLTIGIRCSFQRTDQAEKRTGQPPGLISFAQLLSFGKCGFALVAGTALLLVTCPQEISFHLIKV